MSMHLRLCPHKRKEYNSNYDLITHKKSNKYISLAEKKNKHTPSKNNNTRQQKKQKQETRKQQHHQHMRKE